MRVWAIGTIRKELEDYSTELAERPEIVGLNKIDALNPELVAEQVKQLKKAYKGTPMLISGVTGVGVREALFAIVKHLGLQAEAEADGVDEDGSWSP